MAFVRGFLGIVVSFLTFLASGVVNMLEKEVGRPTQYCTSKAT